MLTRREALQQAARVAGLLAATGIWPQLAWAYNKSAFEAKSLAEVMKAAGASMPVESKDVTLVGPDISENGALVQLACATTLPGVKQLLILVEKNPAILVAAFNISESIEASFTTRAKMAQSSDVYAVALTRDGKAFFAKKEVKVTLGGCAA